MYFEERSQLGFKLPFAVEDFPVYHHDEENFDHNVD